MTALAGALAVGGGAVVGTGPAEAARIVSVTEVSPRLSEVDVFSPAMGKVIRNQVLHLPGRPSAPTFYMLPGLGGAEDGISWMNNGGAPQFFANKRVNAVFPIGGRSSMFTDWQHDDPALGRNKWTTYLTRELPPVIDRAFRTTGVNAISGVSMSAGPALALAEAAPSRYRAVAAYSGCPGTTDPMGVGATTAVVTRGGGQHTQHVGCARLARMGRQRPGDQRGKAARQGGLPVSGVGDSGTDRRRSAGDVRWAARWRADRVVCAWVHGDHVESVEPVGNCASLLGPAPRLALVGAVQCRSAGVVADDRAGDRGVIAGDREGCTP